MLLSVLSWRVSQAWNPHQLQLSPGTWKLWQSLSLSQMYTLATTPPQSTPFPSLKCSYWVALLNLDLPFLFSFTQQRKYMKGYFVVFVSAWNFFNETMHSSILFDSTIFLSVHILGYFFLCNTNLHSNLIYNLYNLAHPNLWIFLGMVHRSIHDPTSIWSQWPCS